MKTIQEILYLVTLHLSKKKVCSPKRSAEALLSVALNITRMSLYLEYQRILTSEEIQKCQYFLRKRSAHEPLEYICGECDFLDLKLHLTKDVLIPRPETEIMVEMMIRELKQKSSKDQVVWDLCTGSGCIGLAVKKACPWLKVVLADICPKALHIAKKNAEKHSLDVEFVEGDFLKPFLHQKCHYFVSNPPYISESEYEHLDPSIKFEPRIACVSGLTSLEFYQEIARCIDDFLYPEGKCWMEIGYQQKKAILALFSKKSFAIQILPDWAGHDRFFLLEKDPSNRVSSHDKLIG